MLGEKLRALRESRGFVQREVAARLQLDTAYVSKMESNEKPVNRAHLKKLAAMFDVLEEDLTTLWLAEKVCNAVKDETLALKAIKAAQNELTNKSKRRIRNGH